MLFRLLDFWGQFSFDFKKRQSATIATQQITYSAIAWFQTKPRHCEKFRNLKHNVKVSYFVWWYWSHQERVFTDQIRTNWGCSWWTFLLSSSPWTMNICIKDIRVNLLNIHEHLHHHEHLHEQHQGKPFEGVVDEHPVLWLALLGLLLIHRTIYS